MAGTWLIYAKAKKYLCDASGTIKLGTGGDIFKMQLHRPSASAAILVVSTRSTAASIPGEISARGGYATGGKAITPSAGHWTVGASATQYKFTYTTAGLIFSAGSSILNCIKYALIKNSAGKVVCFCTLSTSPFDVTSGNTLTVIPNASGVFTLT